MSCATTSSATRAEGRKQQRAAEMAERRGRGEQARFALKRACRIEVAAAGEDFRDRRGQRRGELAALRKGGGDAFCLVRLAVVEIDQREQDLRLGRERAGGDAVGEMLLRLGAAAGEVEEARAGDLLPLREGVGLLRLLQVVESLVEAPARRQVQAELPVRAHVAAEVDRGAEAALRLVPLPLQRLDPAGDGVGLDHVLVQLQSSRGGLARLGDQRRGGAGAAQGQLAEGLGDAAQGPGKLGQRGGDLTELGQRALEVGGRLLVEQRLGLEQHGDARDDGLADRGVEAADDRLLRADAADQRGGQLPGQCE